MNLMILGNQLVCKEEHLIAVAFPKTNSKNFDLVFKVCKGAQIFEQSEIEGLFYHIAIFGRNLEQAQRALFILTTASDWKGFKVFVDRKMLANTFAIQSVIECFIESQSCTDFKAHCFTVHRDPYDTGTNINLFSKPLSEEKYIFPCRKLLKQNFRFQIHHPSKLTDQIQAAAVRSGCNLCPNFHAKEFRKIDQLISGFSE